MIDVGFAIDRLAAKEQISMRIAHMKEAFDVADLRNDLPPELAHWMLKTVMAWATVDGAVSQLYVAIHGLDPVADADLTSDKPAHLKLREIQVTMRPHAPTLARAIGKLKKQYEDRSEIRDTIAHCRYAGTLHSDPGSAVFQRFRAFEGGLIIDILHVAQFKEAVRFGEHLARVALDLTGRIIRYAKETSADEGQ